MRRLHLINDEKFLPRFMAHAEKLFGLKNIFFLEVNGPSNF
jgi:hypothetical protein